MQETTGRVEEILIPGEPDQRRALVRRSQGIPIGDETIREIRTLCEELKVPYLL